MPMARDTTRRGEMVRRLTRVGRTHSPPFYCCPAARDRGVRLADGGGEAGDEHRENHPKTISNRLVRHTAKGWMHCRGNTRWSSIGFTASLAGLHALHALHPALQAHHTGGALRRHWLRPIA